MHMVKNKHLKMSHKAQNAQTKNPVASIHIKWVIYTVSISVPTHYLSYLSDLYRIILTTLPLKIGHF